MKLTNRDIQLTAIGTLRLLSEAQYEAEKVGILSSLFAEFYLKGKRYERKRKKK